MRPAPARLLPWTLLAAYATAVALRAPALLAAPRFWGEEGSVYFAHAARTPFAEAVVAPHLDYLAVWANLATALAALVPLESAPLVTTLAAFAVQCVPAAVIAWSPSPFWTPAWRRAAGVALVLLTPLSAANWLTTIGSQFYLALAAGLLLVEDPEQQGTAGRWTRRVLLALCAVSGPPAAFVAPVYALRALRDRRRETAIQAAIVVAGALVQAGVWAAARAGADAAAPRSPGVHVATGPLVVAMQCVVLPLFGAGVASDAETWLQRTGGEGTWTYGIAGAAAAALLLWGGVRLAGDSPERRRLVLAAALLAILSTLFATGSDMTGSKSALLVPGFGQRYFHAPSVLLMCALLHRAAASLHPTPGRSHVAAALCAIALLAGAWRFRADIRPVVGPGFPDWRAEVAAWRADPSHRPRAWPGDFRVDLAPR